MAQPEHPHDRLFQALLADPDRAGRLIRRALPADLAAELDPAPPVPIDASFIDPSLRDRRSDRLFQVSLADGTPAYLYTLLEHKSRPDARTPLQMLGYMVRIWERHLEQAGGDPRALPPILPLVVYHGAAPWQVPRSVAECLTGAAAVRDHVRHFGYTLMDLGPIHYAQLATDPGLRAGLGALKYAFEPDLSVETLADLFRDLPVDGMLAQQILAYAVRVLDADANRLRAALKAAQPERMEDLMGTAAEDWLRQGEAKGRAEGEAQGKAHTLLRLLERRFGPLPDARREQVEHATNDELDRWTDRLLDAPTLDDVFQGPRNTGT
jgi:predicted transposase YdaD